MGDLQLTGLEPDKALGNFRTALQILGNDQNGNEDHDQGLCKLYWFLGRALNQLGSQPEALVNYWRSVAVAESVAQQFPAKKNQASALF
jgi:hypothetical protein